MRRLTMAGQCVATTLFVVIGVVIYGCADTASVNPVVELASLTVDPGTLQPAFNGGTTQYNVDVSSDITNVSITAQPAVAGDTVTINGQATTSSVITLGAAGTTTPVSIVVSETGTNSRTYTVLVIRADLTGNNSLQNLTVSSGTLAPAFDPNVQAYTVDVANNVGSVTVTPTLSDPAATMTVNGQITGSGQARTVTLNPAGQPTNIPIVVTAQNGNPKSYQVTVSRGVSSNRDLQSLTVSPGTLNPSFNANRTSYTVNVASSATSVTVTPRLQDTTASMTVNGQAATSGQARNVQLGAPGSNTPIFIIVTAQNGTQKTYTVGVNRTTPGGNNNLQSMDVSPGTLDPAFTANRTSYTVNVASSVTSVTVTPRLQDSSAGMTVNGQATDSGQGRTVTLNGEGSSTVINIVVTAPNGSQKIYSITVERAEQASNNNLQSLTVSPGDLVPAFRANRRTYSVDVAENVTSVTVSATKADPNAVMSGSVTAGAGTASGQATISLEGPGTATPVTITVTAPSGPSKSYAITVERAAQASNNNLSALTISPGALDPAFNPSTTNYTVSVASNVTSITVTADLQDTNASMTINGQGASSGQARDIALGAEGSSTNISIRVNPPNGNAKTYTIVVSRTSSGDDGNDGGNGNDGGKGNNRGKKNTDENKGGDRDDKDDD